VTVREILLFGSTSLPGAGAEVDDAQGIRLLRTLSQIKKRIFRPRPEAQEIRNQKSEIRNQAKFLARAKYVHPISPEIGSKAIKIRGRVGNQKTDHLTAKAPFRNDLKMWPSMAIIFSPRQ
jgi:hypothetical protein